MTEQSVGAGSGWDTAAAEIQQSEGGGDFFGKIHIGFGYKFFVKGVPNRETWFPYRYKDDAGKEAALALANQCIVKHGLEVKRVESVFGMYILKEDIFGRDVSAWNADGIWFVEKLFGADFKELVVPSLSRNGIGTSTDTVWGHIIQVPNKTGYMKNGLDAEGHPTQFLKKVGIIAEVFPDEASCRAAAEKASGDAEHSASGLSSIDERNRDILAARAEDKTMTIWDIAHIFDNMTFKDVLAIVNDSVEQVNAEIVSLKGRVSASEAAAFYGKAEAVINRMWK